MMHKRLLIMHA